MIHTIEKNLAALGLTLPRPPAPAATYDAFVRGDKILYISGQLPMKDGALVCAGKVGHKVTLEAAAKAAEICALNILSQVHGAVSGDWDKVKRCVKLVGFVSSAPEFTKQPLVINGASQFMIHALGPDAGRHARSAVGVAVLPFDAPVEVEAIFTLA